MSTTALIQNVTGRLVEYYLRQREMTDDDIRVVNASLERSVKSAVRHTGKIVVVADLRELQVVGPTLADYMSNVMRSDNAYILRSAVLCSPNATFGMQVERVMRESGHHAERRRVTTVDECVQWLGEVLNPEEMIRLTQFLTAGP